jgi:hypothetical protein
MFEVISIKGSVVIDKKADTESTENTKYAISIITTIATSIGVAYNTPSIFVKNLLSFKTKLIEMIS